nr:unnamed protein product [Callosobruchus chinensis]
MSNDHFCFRLLVGAPLGQNLQPGSNHSGALFKCPISTYDNDCIQVETDGRRVGDFDYEEDTGDDEENALDPPGNDEIKTGQWLGVSVKSQKPGGVAMVCAHRYIQSQDLSKMHYGQGLCYLLNNALETTEVLQFCKGRPMDKLHQQYGFCQIGTSANFVGNEFAVVGAPGPYTWRGTMFGQVVVGDFLTKDKTVYHSPLNDDDIIEKYSYLGMSVGGGHFWNKSEYMYIAGAPRSKMIGQVYFFNKRQNSDIFNITMNITGEQFASSFGYEVLAVDVNNDGYDDLLVGAPFYYDDKNGGAVYVYYNIRKCKPDNCTWDDVLYGTHQSRFGFAMTSLGDINKDGYNDVAIGAPYEDDHGTVYVFLGSRDGLVKEPSQVIKYNDPETNMTTFGYSLSGGIDMDNNGYPDLLVGAYESERILLLKTRPIIHIEINIDGKELKNINATRKGCQAARNSNYTCFSFRSCFTISGKLKKMEKFNVTYHISEEKKFVPRIWFPDPRNPHSKLSEKTKIIPVNTNKLQYCEKETVYIKPGVSDILSPIKFKVNYTLFDDAYHSPILNKTSVKFFEATFQKECGNDDICESFLVLKAGTNLKRNDEGIYTVNTISSEFILEAIVENHREPAYEAKLFVVYPKAMSYIAMLTDEDDPNNVKCSSHNATLVICDIGNPFQGNRTAKIKLRFEFVKDTKEQLLDLKLFVNSTSTERSSKTKQRVMAILQKIAKFQIRGKASSNLFYGGEVMKESDMQNLEDIGARVTHKYQIDNNGQWDLPDLKVTIMWPMRVSPGPDSTDQTGKWLLYLESLPRVSGIGVTGYCVVPDGKVNELNLNSTKPMLEEPENLIMPDEFSRTSDSPIRLRRRRAVDYVVPSRTITKGGKKRKVVSMDCIQENSAKCVTIMCTIKKLNRGNQAEIDIKSRIWNSTLVEGYRNVDWVVIKSHAYVELGDKSFNVSSESIPVISAETIAYPEIVLADSGLNWWIIAGAVLAGLLLLVLLIIFLYKCGFFKRKRVSDDPMMSGNLQKKGEAENLLNKEK